MRITYPTRHSQRERISPNSCSGRDSQPIRCFAPSRDNSLPRCPCDVLSLTESRSTRSPATSADPDPYPSGRPPVQHVEWRVPVFWPPSWIPLRPLRGLREKMLLPIMPAGRPQPPPHRETRAARSTTPGGSRPGPHSPSAPARERPQLVVIPDSPATPRRCLHAHTAES